MGTQKVIGEDTSQNVIHNVYLDGLDIPDHMMDPNVGGRLKKCRHVYELVGSPICPDCGRDTHETDYAVLMELRNKHYAQGKHLENVCDVCGGTIRGWWDI